VTAPGALERAFGNFTTSPLHPPRRVEAVQFDGFFRRDSFSRLRACLADLALSRRCIITRGRQGAVRRVHAQLRAQILDLRLGLLQRFAQLLVGLASAASSSAMRVAGATNVFLSWQRVRPRF
jgi:hypothetical protein